MIYGSVCSGIEAASVAWQPLGWSPAFFSEIDKAARVVLQHRHPGVPLHGDFTTIGADDYGSIDLLVGGTPCQDFSVAGLRAGITGDRGNLTLEFLRLAARTKPRWIVWENVPGALSSVSHAAADPCPPPPPLDLECDGQEVDTEEEYDAEENHALNSFLAGLSELGYGFAYRVLDAQYFNLAQRRARLFVVGYLGDWRRAAAVLLERESLLWDPAPSRETGKAVAGTLGGSSQSGGFRTTDLDNSGAFIPVAPTLRAGGNATGGDRPPGTDVDTVESLIAAPLNARPRGRPGTVPEDAQSLIVMASGQANAEIVSDVSTSLTCLHEAPIVAMSFKASHYTRGKDGAPSDVAPPLSADADKGDQDTLIAFADVADPIAANQANTYTREGRGNFRLSNVAIGFSAKDHGQDAGEVSPTLRAGVPSRSHANGGVMPAVAFTQNSRSEVRQIGGDGQIVGALAADVGAQQQNYVAARMQVRRLTPRECERLQGFPDDYTLVPVRGKPAADGPRYKQLGNSMATNVMAWIGGRIQLVEELST